MRKIHLFSPEIGDICLFWFWFPPSVAFFLGNWKDLPVLVSVAFIFTSLRSAVLREFGQSCTREVGIAAIQAKGSHISCNQK